MTKKNKKTPDDETTLEIPAELESISTEGIPISADAAARMPKIVKFDTLARCGDEIWIECNGQIYRLRRTRQGKLILTK